MEEFKMSFGPELFIALLPLIIGLLFAIYFLSLMTRFVAAIEKIADKFENK
jgi:hypothetical protein